MSPSEVATLEVDGHEVTISHPEKVFFSERGETKLDLAQYYVAVGEAALRGVRNRPTVLKRYPNGSEGKFFFQKRLPASRPEWLEGVVITFPSGGVAEELCPVDVAHIVWAVNTGCIDLNPWAVRRDDLDHPDELRIDLDPQPGVDFASVRETTLLVREVLDEYGLVGFPKTSGSRGMHITVPIAAQWSFHDVRRAAVAFARELEGRRGDLVTTAWWKEERGERVFVDYNQNARDRTVASAYSVRANPEGRVSTPLRWDEVADVDPHECTIATVPTRLLREGDPGAAIDDERFDLTSLLERADADDTAGKPDAPWPPFFARQSGETARVAPSRARVKKTPRAKKDTP